MQRVLFGYHAGGDLSTVTRFPGSALARRISMFEAPLLCTDVINLYLPHPKGDLSPLCLWVPKPSLCQINDLMSTKGWVLLQEVSCRTFKCCDRELRRLQLSNACERSSRDAYWLRQVLFKRHFVYLGSGTYFPERFRH